MGLLQKQTHPSSKPRSRTKASRTAVKVRVHLARARETEAASQSTPLIHRFQPSPKLIQRGRATIKTAFLKRSNLKNKHYLRKRANCSLINSLTRKKMKVKRVTWSFTLSKTSRAMLNQEASVKLT